MFSNNKRKVLQAILQAFFFFLICLVALYGVLMYIYESISDHHFPWYNGCIISLFLFALIASFVGFIRSIDMIQEQSTKQISGEVLRYSEKQNEGYRRQMQILCSVLEARTEIVLRDLERQQQMLNEDI